MVVRDQRRQAAHRAEGYVPKQGRGSFLLSVPDEKELLDEQFLRDHCFETSIDSAEGARGLHFRPIQRRRDGVDIRGTIWVEADTYQIRRLELEHVDGDRSLARSSIDYEAVAVDGSTLRLPATGRVTGRPRGFLGTLVTGVAATLTYTYQNFEHIRFE